jgi:hypothetical protein
MPLLEFEQRFRQQPVATIALLRDKGPVRKISYQLLTISRNARRLISALPDETSFLVRVKVYW